MPTNYLLDAGPLSLLAHSNPKRRQQVEQWINQAISRQDSVYIPEISDYEVRREFELNIQIGQMLPTVLQRLDQIAHVCIYLPISTAMWKKAAQLWAQARQLGQPTAHEHELDADVILAAQ